MKPGDLVYVQFKAGEGCSALPGWGTVCWVEEDRVKVEMKRSHRPVFAQLVPLDQIQTPEEVPRRWACRILGLELSIASLNRETGRMTSGFYVKGRGDRTLKLMISGEGCDDATPFTIDLGSAVGVVFLEAETFKYLRYEGVGIPDTDIEAEQDARALNGTTEEK